MTAPTAIGVIRVLDTVIGDRVVPLYTANGTPVNGTSGTLAGTALPGALLEANDGGVITLYQNTGTQASPTWSAFQLGGSPLAPPAGTASAAPLTMTAGTLLTSPAAGAIEFDGSAFYATAVAASRQQIDAEQYAIASSDSAVYSGAGLDSNAAAPVFTTAMGCSANGAITLQAGKTYAFEACYNLTNTGTTSHTWAVLFGGTATITAAQIQGSGNSSATANAAATGGLSGFLTGTDLTNGGNGLVLTAASTSATEQATFSLNGVIIVANAGTLIPELKASARPGASGTPGVTVKKGSFFRIWEMGGAGAVGDWS
jgi:hypothetical protein